MTDTSVALRVCVQGFVAWFNRCCIEFDRILEIMPPVSDNSAINLRNGFTGEEARKANAWPRYFADRSLYSADADDDVHIA